MKEVEALSEQRLQEIRERVVKFLHDAAAPDTGNYDGKDVPHCRACARDEAVVIDVAANVAEHWDAIVAGKYDSLPAHISYYEKEKPDREALHISPANAELQAELTRSRAALLEHESGIVFEAQVRRDHENDMLRDKLKAAEAALLEVERQRDELLIRVRGLEEK
jgi:hypothetical protein